MRDQSQNKIVQAAEELAFSALSHRAEKTRRRGYVSERTLEELSEATLFGMIKNDQSVDQFEEMDTIFDAVHAISEACRLSADAVVAGNFLATRILSALPQGDEKQELIAALKSGILPVFHQLTDATVIERDDCYTLEGGSLQTIKSFPSRLHVVTLMDGDFAGTALVLNHRQRCWHPDLNLHVVSKMATLKLQDRFWWQNEMRLIEQALDLKQSLAALDKIAFRHDHGTQQTATLKREAERVLFAIYEIIADTTPCAQLPSSILPIEHVLAAGKELESRIERLLADANRQPLRILSKERSARDYINHLRDAMLHELSGGSNKTTQEAFIAAAE